MIVINQSVRTADAAQRLALTDAERAELRSVTDDLVGSPPGLLDDLRWVERARRLSCRLPVRLLEEIRRYRHDPGPAGTLLLAGLPVDQESLPDTPTVRQSVERTATVPAAVSMLIGLQLGEIIAYREEKTGALVQNVVPVPGMEHTQSNAGSVPLELHVENAFHPHRPDYVGLMCLRNDHAGTASTLVTCIRDALPQIGPEDLQVLQTPRFVTAPPPSFRTGHATRPHPVLSGHPQDPNICLDFSATAPLDDEAKQALERLRLILAEVASPLVLRSGEMAFVDNRLVLHGRTEFVPRFDGRDRWLHRVYVHLDNRRSRSHREDDGAVLV